MPKTNPDQLTLREVAAALGVSYETAKKWRQRGVLPAPDVYLSRRYQRWERKTIERLGRRRAK